MAQADAGSGRLRKTFDRPGEIELSRQAKPTTAPIIPEITCVEASDGWSRYRPDAPPEVEPINEGEAFLVLAHFADTEYGHTPDCALFVPGTLEACRAKWWQDLRDPAGLVIPEAEDHPEQS